MRIINKESVEKFTFFKTSKYNLEHNGKTFEREFVEIGEAVCALIYNTKTDKYVFVRQFRPGTGTPLTELVGGLPNGDLTPVQCIYEEVLEETGYVSDSIELMLTCNAVPCYSTEKLHMYYVTVSEKKGNGGGLHEDHEYVETIEMTKEEILHFDFQNNSDAKTLLALSLFGFVKQFYSSYRKMSGLMENPDSRWGGC